MRKIHKRQRERAITQNQRAARLIKFVANLVPSLDTPGAERGLQVVQTLSRRSLRLIMAQPARFEHNFPQDNLPRLAATELLERKLLAGETVEKDEE